MVSLEKLVRLLSPSKDDEIYNQKLIDSSASQLKKSVSENGYGAVALEIENIYLEKRDEDNSHETVSYALGVAARKICEENGYDSRKMRHNLKDGVTFGYARSGEDKIYRPEKKASNAFQKHG